MATRKGWADLLKDNLVPAGVGALVGVVGTLALVVSQLFEKAEQISEQQRRSSQIEQDISAYSRAIRKMYPLLSEKQLSNLFEGKGKFLINVDRGRTGDDSLMSAELRKSPEGAYFIWCRTGMNSSYRGASFGLWLTRGEAMAWADSYVTPKEFRALFDEDELKPVDRKIQVGLCG